MNVTETLNEGLKRKLEVTIPAADLKSAQDTKLNDLKAKANIKGFRPGKVPMAHLKSVYGQSVMSEVMQEAVNTIIQDALSERNEKAAMQPKVDFSEDQGEMNRVLAGSADLEFKVTYEVLPEFDLMDFKSIKIERPMVSVAEQDVTREMERIFSEQREYEDRPEDGQIVSGDRVGLNFVGKIDGEPFEGGASDHAHVIVGAGQYIPGFEEQLIGMKKGDSGEIKLTFPHEYAQEHLAGKEAVFDVEILHVEYPKAGELGDEFAKKLGVDDLAAFKDVVSKQIHATHETMSRQRVKRLVLDALDAGHKFDLPAQLVENEFEAIWKRVVEEMEENGQSFESGDTSEEKAREQYQRIAERRVRLGLVVAQVGNANNIEVSDEEHQQALIAEVRRFPGQEQEVYDYYRKTPAALSSLRAPVFENKVVDFVVELADVSEIEVTREELNKLIEALDEE